MKAALYLLGLLIVCSANTQDLDFDITQFKLQVKQPDEFIQRFNGETDTDGQRLEARLKGTARQEYILNLFERSYLQKVLENEDQKTLIREFLEDVTDEKTPGLLHFKSEKWYAQANVQATYLEQPAAIQYTLKTEMDDQKIAKWKIIGVESDFLRFDSSAQVVDESISPISHNINFVKLSTVLNRPKNNLKNFAYSGFEYDDLSVALFMSKSGLLELGVVEELVFYFLDFEGWLMVVRDFQRKDDNAGWLISEVKKLPEGQKLGFLQEYLNANNDFLKSHNVYQAEKKKKSKDDEEKEAEERRLREQQEEQERLVEEQRLEEAKEELIDTGGNSKKKRKKKRKEDDANEGE